MTKKAANKFAKEKAPRKDASQTALSIVEQVTGAKLKRQRMLTRYFNSR